MVWACIQTRRQSSNEVDHKMETVRRKTKGRPRMTWKNQIIEDLKLMGIYECKHNWKIGKRGVEWLRRQRGMIICEDQSVGKVTHHHH